MLFIFENITTYDLEENDLETLDLVYVRLNIIYLQYNSLTKYLTSINN